MKIATATDEPSSIHTRPSLLLRLKAGDDTQSWQAFYQLYGKLVRDFAVRAGLTDAEADEVVQETAIAIARHLPEYRYDPKVCRFKTWLLNQASWRIKDQLRKRKKESAFRHDRSSESRYDDTTRTSTVNRVPETTGTDLDALFEGQWRKNLFEAAVDAVKQRFSLKQFQVFDLLVLQEWPAADVARSLGVSLASVYVTRHRISAAIKKQTKLLEKRLEQAAGQQASEN